MFESMFRATCKFLMACVTLTVLVSCSSSDSLPVCTSTMDISRILNRLGSESDMVGGMTSSDLHNDLERSLYVLELLTKSASSDVTARVTQVKTALLDLSAALDEVDWDIATAATNSKVQSALAAFSDKTVADASVIVSDYTQSLCGTKSSIAISNDASTLPLPIQPSPTATDPPMGLTDNASDAHATGLLVATLFGITATEVQINCLGAALQGIQDVTSASETLEQYQRQFQKAFDSCEIDFRVPKD